MLTNFTFIYGDSVEKLLLTIQISIIILYHQFLAINSIYITIISVEFVEVFSNQPFHFFGGRLGHAINSGFFYLLRWVILNDSRVSLLPIDYDDVT